jgi:hypothetical protein
MTGSRAVTDLTRGVYRRQYAGYINGKRINAVSLEAEAWFWRVNAAADDFGNLPGDRSLVAFATIGRRADVSVDQVEAWCAELLSADLIRHYDVSGERYIHVTGFLSRQPAPRNGKRIRRYPQSPYETEGIQIYPDSSKCSDTDADSDTEDQRSTVGGTAAASGALPPSPAILVFPTSGRIREWNFTEAARKELAEAFDGVDVMAEARKALLWVRSKAGHKKTAGGMMRFLFGWMGRARPAKTFAHSGDNGCEIPEGKNVVKYDL